MFRILSNYYKKYQYDDLCFVLTASGQGIPPYNVVFLYMTLVLKRIIFFEEAFSFVSSTL